jgi:hypothetical protein
LTDVDEQSFGNYDLFEGTEQIQQLVISRAISSPGVHIRQLGDVGTRWRGAPRPGEPPLVAFLRGLGVHRPTAI